MSRSSTGGTGAGGQQPRVSLVLVAHRSSRVLPRAMAAWRREATAAGVAAEMIVVEQSEDSVERDRALSVAPDRLLERPNRGYAAGVNAGVEAARGELLVVGNPDVEPAPGALAALLDALGAGWEIVGPQFELGGFLFPPADLQTPTAELRRWRAAGGGRSWARLWRAELGRWQRVWGASDPVAVPSLSGALLAFSRHVWQRLGPWDEGYFLYFEETEWLRRAARLGLRQAVVPKARAVHAWGHAAEPSRQHGQWVASQRRYYRRCFPLLGRLVLGLPARRRPPLAPAPWPPPDELVIAPGIQWLLSPSSMGLPAARLAPGGDLVTGLEGFSRALPAQRELVVLAAGEDGTLAGAWRWAAGLHP